MKKEKLSAARDEGREIAEVLAYLKSLGFCFEGEDKGYLNCLLATHKLPAYTHRKENT